MRNPNLKNPDRVCACGCGHGLGHMRATALYSPKCAARLGIVQTEPRHRARPKCKATLNPYSNIAGGRNAEPNRSQALCKVCFGMPWARLETRQQDNGTVADGRGRCRGCGEAYAPEPRPEPRSVLASSAGMAVRAGELGGYQSGKPRVERVSRAKHSAG